MASELVLETEKRGTYPLPSGHGDLRQVNLVVVLLVAQTVFATIRQALCGHRCHLFQLLDRPIPVHLEVYADAAVHGAHGHVQVNVCNSGLDNLGEDLASLLIVRHPDANRPTRSKSGSNATRDAVLHLGRQIKVLVNFATVLVVHLDTIAAVWCSRVCLDHNVVEELVECFVMGLHLVSKLTSLH